MSHFQLKKNDAGVRRGTLHTKNGVLATPFYMPDATRGSVRGLSNEQLHAAGIGPMVVNTYHLFLQPGTDVIAKAGGLHTFMQWDGPLLSDSGGYQVFSLIHKNAALGRITEDGAEFRSARDGSKHLLTPERSIEIQFNLGTDMMVVLDDPRPVHAPEGEQEEAVGRTVRWAERCKTAFDHHVKKRKMDEKNRPLLFCVVQGGKSTALRTQCAEALGAIGFDGYSFGARHVDEDGNFMAEVLEHTANAIPQESPRFALGIGSPRDIVRCADFGWDLFDCVIPTREGRHGRLFLWKGKRGVRGDFCTTLNIVNTKFQSDFSPIDEHCDCYCCTHYTRAYLHHLFRAGEPLGPQMASLHNLRFYAQLLETLRG